MPLVKIGVEIGMISGTISSEEKVKLANGITDPLTKTVPGLTKEHVQVVFRETPPHTQTTTTPHNAEAPEQTSAAHRGQQAKAINPHQPIRPTEHKPERKVKQNPFQMERKRAGSSAWLNWLFLHPSCFALVRLLGTDGSALRALSGSVQGFGAVYRERLSRAGRGSEPLRNTSARDSKRRKPLSLLRPRAEMEVAGGADGAESPHAVC